MKYDTEKISIKMEELFNKVVLEEKKLALQCTKEDFLNNERIIKNFVSEISSYGCGKIMRRFIDDISIIQNDFRTLYEDFDDKLMLFIVGDGNAGKSTLVNTLVGEAVAKTNFLPTTWKIDVYFPSNEDKAIIKYKDGRILTKEISHVNDIVENEERKSKEAQKKYNAVKNEALAKLTLEKEIKEMKENLAREYLYKSDIVEVRWPVRSNWILEQCLIVDTPGLNQDLLETTQLGSILDYYHKADGVIWLIDGVSVAGENNKEEIEKLNTVLKSVGGVRGNIIGAINRMDLVQRNAGDEGIKNVIKDANRFFGNVFSNIVPISAKKAFEGIDKNDNNAIKESNIYSLQNTIKNIFIEKADEIKSQAKEKGAETLLNKIKDLIIEFNYKKNDAKSDYDKKLALFIEGDKSLQNHIESQINKTFEVYLEEVRFRVDRHVDSLAEGKGKEFIKNTIYDVSSLSKRIKSTTTIIENDLKRQFDLWLKNAYVSEYKYINHVINLTPKSLNMQQKLNLKEIDNIEIFTPSQEDDLFSILGNMWGKLKFWINKSSIKSKLNNTIKEQCENIKNELKSHYETIINNYLNDTIEKLDSSFEELIFPLDNLDEIKEEIHIFEKLIFEEDEEITLLDILGEK